MSTGGAHPASEATRAMPGFANSETKLAPKEPKKHSLESIESTYWSRTSVQKTKTVLDAELELVL